MVFNCRGRAQVYPRRFVITCADANDSLAGLRWSNWGPTRAFGRGVEWTNNCTPNCASGKFLHRHVRVVFWRIRPVHQRHRHGLFRFTRLSIGHRTHIL